MFDNNLKNTLDGKSFKNCQEKYKKTVCMFCMKVLNFPLWRMRPRHLFALSEGPRFALAIRTIMDSLKTEKLVQINSKFALQASRGFAIAEYSK